jgi:two-component system nitrogen regulation response regulator NtrX
MASLAAEYGRRPKQMAQDALELLSGLSWPGNVRELRNTIERLLIMTPGDHIEVRHLPASLVSSAPAASLANPPGTPGDFVSLAEARDDFEKRYIWRKYQECAGNMSRTAEALRVERSNLYRKMKGYGLIPARKGETVGPV